MKSKIKKIILILAFLTLLLVFIFLSQYALSLFLNKILFENYIADIASENINDVFTIDKIVLFSSCASDTTINSNNTTTINNLTQFTDIAVFINNSKDEEFTLKNTLKSVSIKDLSFNVLPVLGAHNLYFKGLTNFAKYEAIEDNLITSDLNFSVSSENTLDYSKPVLFNNCANPITLSYVNKNVANNYTITNDNNSIVYDGSLLKKCNVILDDIDCNFSFTVYIENNLGEHFKCPVYIDVPLEKNSKSIYDGSITYTYNPNYKFYRYE